jgi:NADH dehydrogenase
MKTIDDALELRACIFGAFELAEAATDPHEADRLLTFVIIGAGATGVEMAGQISELARRTLPGDYRSIDPRAARIILLDAAPAVLPTFGTRLGSKAAGHLRKMGVEVQLGTKVVGVDEEGLEVEDAEGRRRISSLCKIWAAGVAASPLGAQLAEQSGAGLDRAGRVKVQEDLTLPGHPEVFVVGDMISLAGLPGVAQVAIQGGRYAADQIARGCKGKPRAGPFRYRDKGSLAAVSRSYAVASIGPLRIAGFFAWLLWLAVHLMYLIGFKNRFTTLLDWAVAFIGRGRSERTVISQQVLARNARSRRVPH